MEDRADEVIAPAVRGPSAGPLVVARGLSKTYATEPVVDGIDFEVGHGECLGFLGPNGAGKTTTINMISCFVRVGGGSLEVFGHSVDRAQREIKRRLGVVTQENNLDPDLSVSGNLVVFGRYFGLPAAERRRRAADLLEFLQLADKADEHIRHLSGGMRRRLTLARALMSSPELLILDEPTTGLDPQARHVVWQKLRALKRAGVTMLLTTHYMEEAERLCDRLLIMDHGKVLAGGTPAGLIEEHIGREVIECFPGRAAEGSALRALLEAADHVERAGDEVYAFFRDPQSAQAVLPHLGEVDFVHRRATLEDVFLRLTGRELRE
ncbi:MAG: ATP-binding cassette domain-containing protein [Gemmatimonadota bacterium]